MARGLTADKLFNPLKRKKMLRKRIPSSEVVVGICMLAILLGVVAWVLTRRDRFDPSERDVSFAVLQESSVEDTLYNRPMKRWIEPGAVGGEAAPAVDLGIFPAELLAAGWTLDGRVETYEPANLYEKINGAAEQYLAFGFRELHYVTLARDGGFLTVELYDQGDFRNTLGIFAAQRDASRTVERSGDLFYYPTPVGAVGGIGNFYFKISGDREIPAVTDKASQILGWLPRLPVSGGTAPRSFSVLTGDLGLEFDRIAYKPIDVFQYDFLTDFWFGLADDADEARYFLHEAKDADEAEKLFQRLLAEQRYEYEVLEQDGGHAVLEHRYLKTVFSVARSGNMIFGVDGAGDRRRSRDLLSNLERVVGVGEDETYPAS